jgi:hypothetical protein
MNINEQIQPIVASLIENLKVSIEDEVRDKISQEVVAKIASTELNGIIENIISSQLNHRLTNYNFEATTKDQLNKIVAQITNQIDQSLTQAANKQITTEINRQIAAMDIQTIIDAVVERKLSAMITPGGFPDRSIPHTSVDLRGAKLTGDNIKGGIIENFGSTGIEDRASFVQLTLMDHASVFEGPVFAPEIQVKGDLSVNGNLTLTGSMSTDSAAFQSLVEHSTDAVRAGLTDELFASFSNIIYKSIAEQGIDLDRVTQGGKEVVKGNQIGYHITDSNLQRVGLIKDLQTQGESLLSDTLYASNRRIGINTLDPSATLSVWDGECEITLSKRRQDEAYIAAPRYQKLILGSNNKENLVLDVDGKVVVETLVIGGTQMRSAAETPNYDGHRGDIVYNQLPELGSCIGWVCLGATRWAKFGKIE